jgi:hypothetical protein
VHFISLRNAINTTDGPTWTGGKGISLQRAAELFEAKDATEMSRVYRQTVVIPHLAQMPSKMGDDADVKAFAYDIEPAFDPLGGR